MSQTPSPAPLALVTLFLSAVMCHPLYDSANNQQIADGPTQRLWRRFVEQASPSGSLEDLHSIRTKRSAPMESCEKLELCKLHARSGTNFFAAYELYFVNKENSKLWDHRTHTMSDCEQQFAAACGGQRAPSPPAAPRASRTHQDDGEVVDDNDDYDT